MLTLQARRAVSRAILSTSCPGTNLCSGLQATRQGHLGSIRSMANVMRIAAFAHNGQGGNPAGVCIQDSLPGEADMLRVAADVGFSETTFAAKCGNDWIVRYFSPETEVPFCGHATIALGAALAKKCGDGVYNLSLKAANITVEGRREGDQFAGALQSPPTSSSKADEMLVANTMSLFGYTQNDLDHRIPPAIVDAGNKHLLIALRDRAALSNMKYDMDTGRKLMTDASLVTIIFAHAEENQLFHVRNAFASGGVYEDPATGSAAAALAGYLRDLEWPHESKITIMQGQDMGTPSRITAEIPLEKGTSVRVSGMARMMD